MNGRGFYTSPLFIFFVFLRGYVQNDSMKQEIVIRNLEDIDRAAAEFLSKIGDNRLVAFYASMGAGKTTFTTALCRKLGVTDPVGSPTFAIINEYM